MGDDTFGQAITLMSMLERLTALEDRRKDLQVRTQELQAERNSRSRAIGKAKAAGEDIQPLLAAVADLGDRLKAAEEALGEVQQALNWNGFYDAAIDADFGPGTRRAMEAWQRASGFEVTGVLSTAQRRGLIEGGDNRAAVQ